MAFVVVTALSATAASSCEVVCSKQATTCHASCEGPRCTSRCGDRQNACIAGCDLDRTRRKEAKVKKKAAPCEVSLTGAARPCNERERAEMKKAMGSAQARSLCRDAGGNITACPEDLETAQVKYDGLQAKCRDRGGKGAECSSLPQ